MWLSAPGIDRMMRHETQTIVAEHNAVEVRERRGAATCMIYGLCFDLDIALQALACTAAADRRDE